MTDDGHTLEEVSNRVADAIDRLFGEASTGAVFSTSEQVGDDVIIRAAAWERAGGFGFGGGGGTGPDGEAGEGAGGGGGGAAQGRPVAVIRVGAHGVEVHPVIDYTKIGVTALFAAIGLWRALGR